MTDAFSGTGNAFTYPEDSCSAFDDLCGFLNRASARLNCAITSPETAFAKKDGAFAKTEGAFALRRCADGERERACIDLDGANATVEAGLEPVMNLLWCAAGKGRCHEADKRGKSAQLVRLNECN